ncbi:MAG: hypothetical protein AAGA23_01240 [Pseudomonadota bacterium]
MTHLLYRPHVAGPQNDITTPDLIIDRVIVKLDSSGQHFPAHRLTVGTELQTFGGSLRITPCGVLVAAGGGPLVGAAALVQPEGSDLAAADLLLGRTAWRLRNLINHFDALRLEIFAGEKSATSTGAELAGFETALRKVDDEPALPRGVACVLTNSSAAVAAAAPVQMMLTVDDAVLNRTLKLGVNLVSADAEPWEERPLPRYTVGPVGEVKHYI